MASSSRTKRAAPPASSTLLLLVRHGQTPTTGATLPGRAKGLHLAADMSLDIILAATHR